MDCYGRHGSLHGTAKELEEIDMKIWDILEGPLSRDDDPNSDEWPTESNYTIVCKVEEDHEIFETDFFFEVYEDAYEWKVYFETNIEPLIINEGTDDA